MSGLRQRRMTLQLERQELRLRCAAQRAELLRSGQALTPRLALADRAADGARAAADWMRAHPELVLAGGVAAVLLLRPRRMLGWAGTLVGLWSFWKRVQPMVSAFMPPPRR